MNKDAILATVIGFGVGLVIAAGVFLGPTIIKSIPKIKILQSSTKPKPTPTPVDAATLTIQSPLPEAIETKNETLVTGKTVHGAIVVIETDGTETVAVANDAGSYAGKIQLIEGKNDIIVTSYAGNKTQTQTVTVYFTPEDF